MTKEVSVREEVGVAKFGGGLGIAGVEGFDMSDLPMPFVRLVHPTSKSVDLAAGGRANPGSWYHNTKKIAKESMEVVFFYAKKVEVENLRNPGEMLPGVRILAVSLDDLETPFAMQFTKGGYWAYKNLLGAMKAWKMSNLYERYVLLGSKTVKSQQGDEFLVPTMDLSEELTKEQKATLSMVAEHFGSKIDSVVVKEDEEEEKDGGVPDLSLEMDPANPKKRK